MDVIICSFATTDSGIPGFYKLLLLEIRFLFSENTAKSYDLNKQKNGRTRGDKVCDDANSVGGEMEWQLLNIHLVFSTAVAFALCCIQF